MRVQLEKQIDVGKRKREDACADGAKLKMKERKESKELVRKCKTENEGSCRWSIARIDHAKRSLVEVM